MDSGVPGLRGGRLGEHAAQGQGMVISRGCMLRYPLPRACLISPILCPDWRGELRPPSISGSPVNPAFSPLSPPRVLGRAGAPEVEVSL